MQPSRFVLPVCLGLTLAASSAQAAPCSSLPNPIILAGASAWTFFLQGMATVLAGQPTPVTLVLQNKIGSCGAVRSITEDVTPTGSCAPGACTTGTAIYWNPSGMPQSCDLDPAGTHVDVGVGDLFIETCIGSAPPADTKSFYSPVLPMNIIVNKASTQKAMTAEEGYFAWGFGNRGMANPWINESFLFIRNVNSGTQNLIALSVGIPPAKMKGIDRGSATGVIDAVAGAADVEAAIGIASAEYYDQNRNKVKALAFRGFRQRYAYYADSSATAFDKRNVRDGHYLPWGYAHMIVKVDGTGTPVKPQAKMLVDWVLGQAMNPPFDIVDLQARGFMVPECAMSVQRTRDLGDLSPHQPKEPCGCFFEKTTTGSTACTACMNDSTCSGGKCRRGYCEAR